MGKNHLDVSNALRIIACASSRKGATGRRAVVIAASTTGKVAKSATGDSMFQNLL